MNRKHLRPDRGVCISSHLAKNSTYRQTVDTSLVNLLAHHRHRHTFWTSFTAFLCSGLRKLCTRLTCPHLARVKYFARFRTEPPSMYSCQRLCQVLGRIMRRARAQLLPAVSVSSLTTRRLQTKRFVGLTSRRGITYETTRQTRSGCCKPHGQPLPTNR